MQRLIGAPLALALLLAPAMAEGSRSVEIVDPHGDPTIYATSPILGLPDPSIDFLAIDFWRTDRDIVVDIGVAGLARSAPYPFEVQRVWTVYFESDFHDLIVAMGVERDGRPPYLLLTCEQRSTTTCATSSEDRIEVDPSKSLVRFRLPMDVIRGKVIGPRASSHLEFVGCPCPDIYPNFGIQDVAPNGRRGFDFDPYSS